MLDVISRAKNAIEAYNTGLRIHSANIGNMTVNGYKRLDVSFQTVFERALHGGTPALVSENLGGTNPLQLGTGMGIANVGVDFTQGDLTLGADLDLAIVGEGLFMVSPDGGETMLYVRTGKFHLDANQNLVTETGMQVYGLRRSAGLTVGTAVPIDLSGVTLATDELISWDEDGVLAKFTKDAEGNYVKGEELGYHIALTTFNNLSGLLQTRGTAFAETLSSGSPETPEAPGSQMGVVMPRQLEQSNVFYITEVIDTMEAQRAMSANLTVIRTVSDIISMVINRLGA